MRLRNIPAAAEAIEKSPICIKEPERLKGQWRLSLTDNRPIHIEIGMGKGQFITQMALEHPDRYYLGMECYGSVLYRALQKLQEQPVENLSLLCYRAEDLEDMFAPGEIDRIYLNFSDPWPKDRHAKRRLTSCAFLDRYAVVLKADGLIEFKTDNVDLFDFSLEQFEAHEAFTIVAKTYDLHNDVMLNFGNIMTEYEQKFSEQGNPICKLVAQKTASFPS